MRVPRLLKINWSFSPSQASLLGAFCPPAGNEGVKVAVWRLRGGEGGCFAPEWDYPGASDLGHTVLSWQGAEGAAPNLP